MERPHRPSTPWPLGLAGMLILVAVVEFSLSRDPIRFADTASFNWRLAVDDVAREARSTEIACLGDSLTKIGIVPEVIQAQTGQRTYNFAMARAPAQATYFVFRRLLEAGGQPKALIVDFKSSIQAGRPRLGIRHFEEIVTPREAWEFAREDGHTDFLLPFVLNRVVPSIRYRVEIREAVACALAARVAPTIATNLLAQRNWSINRGNHFNASTTPFSGEVPANVIESIGVEHWKCQRVNEQAIDKILKLAGSRSIPVYWIIPPLSPPLQERREKLAVDDDYTRFVRSMLARHPGLRVIDGRHSGYGLSEFSDSTHLNGRGSVAFSHEVAAIVGQPEGRPRWVALPPFHPRTIDGRFEDIDQSRVAVETGAGASAVRR